MGVVFVFIHFFKINVCGKFHLIEMSLYCMKPKTLNNCSDYTTKFHLCSLLSLYTLYTMGYGNMKI